MWPFSQGTSAAWCQRFSALRLRPRSPRRCCQRPGPPWWQASPAQTTEMTLGEDGDEPIPRWNWDGFEDAKIMTYSSNSDGESEDFHVLSIWSQNTCQTYFLWPKMDSTQVDWLGPNGLSCFFASLGPPIFRHPTETEFMAVPSMQGPLPSRAHLEVWNGNVSGCPLMK